MASLNQCNFIGNVGQIETKYLPSGEAVTNLSLAVNDKYKDKAGQIVEHTEWVRVGFFGKLAEITQQYVHKGDPIYVSGQMKTRKWQDKDGQDRYSTEIRGDRMQMLSGGSGGDGATHEQRQNRQAARDISQRGGMAGGAQPSPRGGGLSGFDDMSDGSIPF